MDRTGLLEFIAGQSVFIAALVHLTLGVRGWLRWAQAGFLIPNDFRWPAFVVSAIVILIGLYVASHREDRRPFYVGGIIVMAGYAVGYFVWHLTGHRPLLLFGEGAGTEAVGLQWFLDHLLAGPVEFASLFFEGVAVVVLAALLISVGDSDSKVPE